MARAVKPKRSHEKEPWVAARAAPTPTDMADMVKDHGRIAKNQFLYEPITRYPDGLKVIFKGKIFDC
jgi:hypothetical protein